jgi:hypothetical protein
MEALRVQRGEDATAAKQTGESKKEPERRMANPFKWVISGIWGAAVIRLEVKGKYTLE